MNEQMNMMTSFGDAVYPKSTAKRDRNTVPAMRIIVYRNAIHPDAMIPERTRGERQLIMDSSFAKRMKNLIRGHDAVKRNSQFEEIHRAFQFFGTVGQILCADRHLFGTARV